ncbi:helix-turn-helix domain-containing protein [Corallococcus terminator]
MAQSRKRRPERADQYESPAYHDLQARLAAAVRHLREVKGWTQEEAAHRCGMTTRLLQRVEGEDVNATFTTLARLCGGFEVDVAQLFQRSPSAKHET